MHLAGPAPGVLLAGLIDHLGAAGHDVVLLAPGAPAPPAGPDDVVLVGQGAPDPAVVAPSRGPGPVVVADLDPEGGASRPPTVAAPFAGIVVAGSVDGTAGPRLRLPILPTRARARALTIAGARRVRPAQPVIGWTAGGPGPSAAPSIDDAVIRAVTLLLSHHPDLHLDVVAATDEIRAAFAETRRVVLPRHGAGPRRPRDLVGPGLDASPGSPRRDRRRPTARRRGARRRPDRPRPHRRLPGRRPRGPQPGRRPARGLRRLGRSSRRAPRRHRARRSPPTSAGPGRRPAGRRRTGPNRRSACSAGTTPWPHDDRRPADRRAPGLRRPRRPPPLPRQRAPPPRRARHPVRAARDRRRGTRSPGVRPARRAGSRGTRHDPDPPRREPRVRRLGQRGVRVGPRATWCCSTPTPS